MLWTTRKGGAHVKPQSGSSFAVGGVSALQDELIGEEWSEAVDERQTVHLWHCAMCGYDFETLEDCVEQPLPDASLVQEFLPNLIVG